MDVCLWWYHGEKWGTFFFCGGGMDGAGARSLEYIRVLLA
jgi:hypothetical protein